MPGAYTPGPVNFGIRHIGDPAPSQSLTLANTAVDDGFSERLNATIESATGEVTTNGGSITQLGAGASDNSSLSVGIGTATVGDKSGTARITLASDGTGTSGLSLMTLPSQTVSVVGQVNYFAEAQLIFRSGTGAVTMISPTHYVLDFGSLLPNTGNYGSGLSIENFLRDPVFQDELGGSFITNGVDDFALAGFTSFSGISPGAAQDEPHVTFDTAEKRSGSYSNTLSFLPMSSNASSVTGRTPIQLDLRAQVVPEPSTPMLLSLSAGILALRRRRKSAI
jgi:hypothetical protein